MKNYKVKVTRYFTDKYTGQERNVGDTFICEEERCNFLKDNNAVEIIEIIEDAEVETMDEEDKIVEDVKPKKNNKKKSK